MHILPHTKKNSQRKGASHIPAEFGYSSPEAAETETLSLFGKETVPALAQVYVSPLFHAKQLSFHFQIHPVQKYIINNNKKCH